MDRWGRIKQLFGLTPDEDEKRKAILEHLFPYLDIIFSRFYETILQDKNLNKFILKENIPRLLRSQKEFVSFLLSAQIDEHFYNKIVKVGQLHYRIGLKPSYLAYGFHLLTSILYEIVQKDNFLQGQFCFLLKFLKVAELVMTIEYFQYGNLKITQKEHLLDILNDLYLGFKVHQDASETIKKLWFYKDKKSFCWS